MTLADKLKATALSAIDKQLQKKASKLSIEADKRRRDAEETWAHMLRTLEADLRESASKGERSMPIVYNSDGENSYLSALVENWAEINGFDTERRMFRGSDESPEEEVLSLKW